MDLIVVGGVSGVSVFARATPCADPTVLLEGLPNQALDLGAIVDWPNFIDIQFFANFNLIQLV